MNIQDIKVECQMIHPDAKAPTRAHANDAGMDLYAYEDVVIEPNEYALIPTGIKVAVPAGYAMIVKDKSSRACKHHLSVGAGVIDSGYRGEVMVYLYNHGSHIIIIAAGEKIAQALIVPVWTGQVTVVESLSNPDTTRGAGGFGSTGLV